MDRSGNCINKEIVAEALTEENYEDWFDWVKNYLIAQDLWEVVDGTIGTPPEDNKEEFMSWRRKNAAALHIIQVSCGTHSFSHIRGVSEAYEAWNILNNTYSLHELKPLELSSVPPVTVQGPNYDVKILFAAIQENNCNAVIRFFHDHANATSAMITPIGQTALHVAAQYGHLGVVEALVNLVSPSELEIKDIYHLTPLAAAAYCGVDTRVAKCLVDKNANAICIPSGMLLPVTLAFYADHREMGRYLYSITPLEVLKPQDEQPLGLHLLRTCFTSGNLALDLLQQCKELLFATLDNGKWSPVIGIAVMPWAFSIGSELVFWKRWIYNCVRISTTPTNEVRLDIQQEAKSERNKGFISKLKAYDFLGIKEICEEKSVHTATARLVRTLAELTALDRRVMTASNAVFRAAREGNVEFVRLVSKACPQIMLLRSEGSLWHIFFYAVAYRQPEVFSLIHGFRFKKVAATMMDASGNGLLHVAAMLVPSHQLNRISGAALKMQREMQWYKEVESVVPSGLREHENKEGNKPFDIFKESHKELKKQGERWMKDTASSCSVVGTLIVTIMFAAIFTVPGGNYQDDPHAGYPIFWKKRPFTLFVISDALSFFSSATSVLVFLGILTSRYAEEDFLKSLPMKLIIGLSSLFLSIVTMMIAFSATILLMLKHRSQSLTILPAILFASSVPVTIYVMLQFSLLVELISSTYGRGIFKRKVNRWP